MCLMLNYAFLRLDNIIIALEKDLQQYNQKKVKCIGQIFFPFHFDF